MRLPRAPLYNLPPHQGLSSPLPTPPASTSYDPPPISGQDRDEACPKYLMRRVLHFPSGPTAAYRDDGSAFHFMLDCALNWEEIVAKRLLSEDQLMAELNSQLCKDEAYEAGMAFVAYPDGAKGGEMSGYSTTGPFHLTGVYARVAHKMFSEFALKV
ncbi:MAG: hypothetical protein ACREV1_05985 [Gammaproteobacteria bacterium]